MNKIKLKLTRMELSTWIGFIESTYPSVYYKSHHEGKLIESCLAELLYKLKTKEVLFVSKYSFSITIAQGLSFVIYAKKYLTLIHSSDQITINKIIGIIDQKTV